MAARRSAAATSGASAPVVVADDDTRKVLVEFPGVMLAEIDSHVDRLQVGRNAWIKMQLDRVLRELRGGR